MLHVQVFHLKFLGIFMHISGSIDPDYHSDLGINAKIFSSCRTCMSMDDANFGNARHSQPVKARTRVNGLKDFKKDISPLPNIKPQLADNLIHFKY